MKTIENHIEMISLMPQYPKLHLITIQKALTIFSQFYIFLNNQFSKLSSKTNSQFLSDRFPFHMKFMKPVIENSLVLNFGELLICLTSFINFVNGKEFQFIK
jgi:hypothetical protein